MSAIQTIGARQAIPAAATSLVHAIESSSIPSAQALSAYPGARQVVHDKQDRAEAGEEEFELVLEHLDQSRCKSVPGVHPTL